MYYICKQFKLSGQELFVLNLIVGNEIKKIITIKIEILTFNCPNSFRVGVTKRAAVVTGYSTFTVENSFSARNRVDTDRRRSLMSVCSKFPFKYDLGFKYKAGLPFTAGL